MSYFFYIIYLLNTKDYQFDELSAYLAFVRLTGKLNDIKNYCF